MMAGIASKLNPRDSPAPMVVRPAEARDLPLIAAIYDREVLHTTVTMDTVVRTADEYRAWLETHPVNRYPVFVCELDGEVRGWASLTPYSPRRGYDRCAEVSVYVHHQFRGQGLGLALLQRLVDVAPSCGVFHLLARIESTGSASLGLHASAGFRRVGLLSRVGEKFGQVVDVVLMERVLDA